MKKIIASVLALGLAFIGSVHAGMVHNHANKVVRVKFVKPGDRMVGDNAPTYAELAPGASLATPEANGFIFVKGIPTGNIAHDDLVQPDIKEFAATGQDYSITECRENYRVVDVGASDKGTLKNNTAVSIRYKFIVDGVSLAEYQELAAGASIDIPSISILAVKILESGTDRSPAVVSADPRRSYEVANVLQEFKVAPFFEANYVKEMQAQHEKALADLQQKQQQELAALQAQNQAALAALEEKQKQEMAGFQSQVQAALAAAEAQGAEKARAEDAAARAAKKEARHKGKKSGHKAGHKKRKKLAKGVHTGEAVAAVGTEQTAQPQAASDTKKVKKAKKLKKQKKAKGNKKANKKKKKNKKNKEAAGVATAVAPTAVEQVPVQ